MKFWAGVTDNRWYQYLAHAKNIDEVNFWQPSGRPPFTNLPEGTPFLFKAKAPHHHFVGGAYFIRYESLPLPLAWDAFGDKNGCATYRDIADRIVDLRSGDDGLTPEIGCSILGEPVFWPESEWIPADEYFPKNVVVGKTYDAETAMGQRLWDQVQLRMAAGRLSTRAVTEEPLLASYGNPVLMRPRRGQGTFRATVTNAYQRRCAITGEHTLPVLEAAHIKSYAREGFNNTFNGLLLRSDFHKLFDIGLVTVTPDYRVQVSDQIKTSWFNGKAYNRLHGELLSTLPENPADRPRPDLLAWHNENVFEKPRGYGQP